MDKVWSHLRAIYGLFALMVTVLFLQGSAYANSLMLGDYTYLPCVLSLTIAASLYACSRIEKLPLASLFSMAVAFFLLAVFTSFNWLIRSMFYDLQIPFSDPMIRDPFVRFVITPMMIIAIVLPPVSRFFRHDRMIPDTVI